MSEAGVGTDALVREHLGTARQAALWFCRRRRRGVPFDDAYADALLGVWRGLRTFDPARGKTLRNWLFRKAVSVMADGLRTRRGERLARRRAEVSLDEPVGRDPEPLGALLADGGPGPSDRLEQEEEVWRLLRLVRAPYRRVLYARHVEGMTGADLARRYGVGESWVSQLTAAAADALREALARKGVVA